MYDSRALVAWQAFSTTGGCNLNDGNCDQLHHHMCVHQIAGQVSSGLALRDCPMTLAECALGDRGSVMDSAFDSRLWISDSAVG